MTPRVYVAGSSAEPLRAKAAAEKLRELGIEIHHPWWEQVLDIGPQNDSKDRQSCVEWARGDIAAVIQAEAVLFLGSAEHNSRGAHVELGVAIAASTPVVLVPGGAGSIFYALAHSVAETDEEGIQLAASLAKDRACFAAAAS